MRSCRVTNFVYYSEAFPRGSNGNSNAMNPESKNRAPETYMGTDVAKLAYSAIIGAIIPKTLFAVATIALPVPRSLVGKSSGDIA